MRPSVIVGAATFDTVIATAARLVSPFTFETDPRLPRQRIPGSDGAAYLKGDSRLQRSAMAAATAIGCCTERSFHA